MRVYRQIHLIQLRIKRKLRIRKSNFLSNHWKINVKQKSNLDIYMSKAKTLSNDKFLINRSSAKNCQRKYGFFVIDYLHCRIPKRRYTSRTTEPLVVISTNKLLPRRWNHSNWAQSLNISRCICFKLLTYDSTARCMQITALINHSIGCCRILNRSSLNRINSCLHSQYFIVRGKLSIPLKSRIIR